MVLLLIDNMLDKPLDFVGGLELLHGLGNIALQGLRQ